MITSKQRAYLRKIANDIPAIFQIGKHNITPELTNSINDALEARELVKISILSSCTDDMKYIADILHERTHSDVVQVIGKKIVLYRPSKDTKKNNITIQLKTSS